MLLFGRVGILRVYKESAEQQSPGRGERGGKEGEGRGRRRGKMLVIMMIEIKTISITTTTITTTKK